MKLDAGDLMSLQTYAACRPAYRARAIAHRLSRTVPLGPAMRLQFEDAHTIRYQVQEVLHLERTADPLRVRNELDTYAHLLPDGTQWKASLLIELPHAAEHAREMPMLSEAAHRVYVQVCGQACVFAFANEDQSDRHRSRPSGVHFLRFQLPRAMCGRVLAGAAVAIGCTHPDYPWQTLIPAATLAGLRLDLAPASLLREHGWPASAPASDRPDGESCLRFRIRAVEDDESVALRVVRPLGSEHETRGLGAMDEASAAQRELERILANAVGYPPPAASRRIAASETAAPCRTWLSS